MQLDIIEIELSKTSVATVDDERYQKRPCRCSMYCQNNAYK